MNPIGGYFELELEKAGEYHKSAIRLNSGRNAFEYILRAKCYKKVYLPYYTCDVLLEPINRLNLEYEFYNINEQLEPIFNYSSIGVDDAFLCTNYFGIKSQLIRKISNICSHLIIDNCQAFFEKPILGFDSFYSPRKFFGVPDGAYLYTDKFLKTKLSCDNSCSRFSHLIKRIDEGAEVGYADFKANDKTLKGQSIKLMSSLTQAILCSINYDKVIMTRKQNFIFLQESLKITNKLNLPESSDMVPMVFPYLVDVGYKLKQKLIHHGIFIASYWPNVKDWISEDSIEAYLLNNLLAIPLDQRYTVKEMKIIIDIINHYA